ncbi:solute carrier family 35 member F5-like isoform X2 [Babylonia areolata]|uniref:solute carrier family 35 member F5-like isoform X2 n=1 Tax=Babylonia areolata TaxID=304850 RepID=UPI003FD28B8D
MFGVSRSLTQGQRLALGVLVLLIVDVIWVTSYELTQSIFKSSKYDKPFFTTYVRTVMFSLYLFGFLLWRPWRERCCRKKDWKLMDDAWSGSPSQAPETHLGDPIFIPVKYDNHTSGTESDDTDGGSEKSVRFSNISEVRQLSDEFAEDAVMSRLSYQAFLRAEEERLRLNNRLSIKQVVKLAIVFTFLWFFSGYMYREAQHITSKGIVNVMTSTCGLFTLICAAIYPGSHGDKFTLSKLTVVLISIGGVVMVSMSSSSMTEDAVPVGALWALASAIFYAFYLVLMRYRVNNEDRMDIPMFLGFVGLVCALLLWPGFFILHYSKQEVFVWPDTHQWLLLLIDGLISSVFAASFWLWGCFLTSSLVATLALTLINPLYMIAEVVNKQLNCSVLFYVGSAAIFFSFFVVVFLTSWETWDPVLLSFKKLLHCLCRRRVLQRIRELDREQTASLINADTA